MFVFEFCQFDNTNILSIFANMKTLYITRHGKSSWDFPNLPDQERPLIDRGVNKTKKVISELNKHGVSVDLIISSHAKRAHETAKLIAAGINYPIDNIHVISDIYKADSENLIEMLFTVDNNIDSVMIVGHNPTLTRLSNYFLDEKIDILPTSGTVCIAFETSNWTDIMSAPRKTGFVVFPKIQQ